MTKDLLDKSHLAALRDALSGVDAQTSAFVLIDPSVQPDVRRRLKGQHLSSVPLELPGVATGGDADDVLPFLVRVPEQADQRDVLLKKTLAWAAEFHSATWLASDWPVQALAHSLGTRMDAQLSGGMRVFLRIADARVLKPLYDTLEERQHMALLSGVKAWCYLDRQERLQALPSVASTEETFDWPLQLTQVQEDNLLEAALADSVLLLLKQNASRELEQLPRDQRHAFVVAQIASAKEWNILSAPSITQFCMTAFEEGHDFHHSPEWRSALGRVQRGEINLAQAIVDIVQERRT